MNIDSYTALLNAARAQAQPQRMLFAFARAELPDGAGSAEQAAFDGRRGGTLAPVMCVDKTLDELGTFEDLVAQSRHTGKDWDIVFVSSMSGRGGKPPGSAERPTMDPGSVSRALSRTAPRSRLGSPYACWTCRPSHTAPLSRTSAGAAPGSRVQSSTSRSDPVSVRGAVAAGTNSRIAIRSHSPGSPANGRDDHAAGAPPGAPWHAL